MFAIGKMLKQNISSEVSPSEAHGKTNRNLEKLS